jgi:hypothetical protein
MKQIDNDKVTEQFKVFGGLYSNGIDRGTLLTPHAEERINLFLGIALRLVPKQNLLIPFLEAAGVGDEVLDLLQSDRYQAEAHLRFLEQRHGELWDLFVDIPETLFMAVELKNSAATKFGAKNNKVNKTELQRHLAALKMVADRYDRVQYLTITPLPVERHLLSVDKDTMAKERNRTHQPDCNISIHSAEWSDTQEVFRIRETPKDDDRYPRYKTLYDDWPKKQGDQEQYRHALNAFALAAALLNTMKNFDSIGPDKRGVRA